MDHLATAVDPFVFRLSIFVLAVFVGYYVVWSVTPALHTPLMSVTNAISSVIVVGALLAVGVALVANDQGPLWARALGFVALVFASVNIFGGFLVTQRMLAMYQKKKNDGGYGPFPSQNVAVMPALVAGIHVFFNAMPQRRGWPGHRRAKARRSSNGYARP